MTTHTQLDEDEFKRSMKSLAAPRSSRPRRQSECTRHEALVTDCCYWCGADLALPPVPRERDEA